MSRITLNPQLGFDPLVKLKQYQPQLSWALTLLLLVFAAWIAGKSVWLLFDTPSSIQPWQPQTGGQVAKGQSQQLDLTPLQNSNLFGRYQLESKPVVQQPVVRDAPKSRLNLTLVGVVISSQPEKSLAVIANRGSQATYGLGEAIEGTQASLKNVLSDRVIIDNSGRDETVMLAGIDYKKLTPERTGQPQRVSNIQTNNPADNDEMLEQIRAELQQNPQQIFQYVRMAQVKRDEQIVGYRLSPGKSKLLFDAVGLQEGDIATQLNGMDLSDPEVMNQIYQSISDLTELNLTVERDGQSYDIYIQL